MLQLSVIYEHCSWTEYTTTAKAALQNLRPSTAARERRKRKRSASFHDNPELGISKLKPRVSPRNIVRLPRTSSEPAAGFLFLLDAIEQAQLDVKEEAQLDVTAVQNDGASPRTFQFHEDLENVGQLQEIVESLEPPQTPENDILHRGGLEIGAYGDADPFDGAESSDAGESSDAAGSFDYSDSSDDSDDLAFDGVDMMDFIGMSEYNETVIGSDEFWDSASDFSSNSLAS